ncbi:12136_t:CDS:1, partial [Funneliformis geosporum]
NDGYQRNYGYQRPQNFQSNNAFPAITPQQNNLICYLCNQPRHIRRNCPNNFNISYDNPAFQHNQTSGSNATNMVPLVPPVLNNTPNTVNNKIQKLQLLQLLSQL